MESLDTRQLRAFQELGRRGSFTVAARNLGLTQSAVSHSIKSLETTVGASLFERAGKQVTLTPEGELLMPHVDRIFSGMRAALRELEIYRKPGHGRLRIGSTVTLSQYVMPSVIRELRGSFPAYEFSVVTDDTEDLLIKLNDGEIDVAVGLAVAFTGKVAFQPLFEDQIAMAMAPAHPLVAMSGRELELSDLRSQRYIFYSQSSETFRLVERFLRTAKIEPAAPLHMGSMAGIKEMAKIGMGIGLIAPWVAEHELRNGSLVFRDLPGDKIPTRKWGMYSDPSRERGLVEEAFAGICRAVIESLQVRTENLRRPVDADGAGRLLPGQ